MLQVETSGGKTLEFTGRHETVSARRQGLRGRQAHVARQVLPPAIELVNWEEIEGKASEKNGKGQGGLFE